MSWRKLLGLIESGASEIGCVSLLELGSAKQIARVLAIKEAT
jgi:hypothetical protein